MKKINKIDLMIIILGIISIIIILFVLAGCDELSSKLLPEMNDKINDIQDVSVKTNKTVEGSHNEIKEVNDNSKLTMQTFNKRMDTISNQINDSATVSAEEIGELTQKVNNTHNSTILMIVLFSISALLNIILMLIIFWIIRKLFELKGTVYKIISRDDNDLTVEKWNALDNAPKI